MLYALGHLEKGELTLLGKQTQFTAQLSHNQENQTHNHQSDHHAPYKIRPPHRIPLSCTWEERARRTRDVVTMNDPAIAERPQVGAADAYVAQLMLAHPIE